MQTAHIYQFPQEGYQLRDGLSETFAEINCIIVQDKDRISHSTIQFERQNKSHTCIQKKFSQMHIFLQVQQYSIRDRKEVTKENTNTNSKTSDHQC